MNQSIENLKKDMLSSSASDVRKIQEDFINLTQEHENYKVNQAQQFDKMVGEKDGKIDSLSKQVTESRMTIADLANQIKKIQGES